MAAAAVLPPPVDIKRSWVPIITPPTVSKVGNDEFNPTRHISYKEAPKVYTMKDIGMPEDKGISTVAVSEPFPLFTEEAVMRMRQEVLSPEVLSNCLYSSNLASCQLRGFANKYAPFVYDVWKSPEVLAIVSKVAGIDLVTEMDFEIGHINISVNSEEAKQEQIKTFKDGAQGEDDKPIVGWHTDSYPFVCVTMLSDCTTMIGGETALRTGTGDIMKVRGPQMGCAVVLQGRYIEHQALRALGTTERISMVTSFRPRCPKVRDDTVLTTVRPVSDLGELYNQFSEYRLEILEERIRQQLKELRESNSAGRKVATRKLKAFFLEQEKFLAHMNRELVDDDEVIRGNIDDSHLLKKNAAAVATTTKKAEAKSKKRPRRF
ncbi:hypothetical protein F4677DRAFT_439820 [Hypoxylon crocopeplum]|nr:hypothetical protein F4677DRAFT_439820 [Hypoxylon crocopeplum]